MAQICAALSCGEPLGEVRVSLQGAQAHRDCHPDSCGHTVCEDLTDPSACRLESPAHMD